MGITDVRIFPPLAVARLGSSPEPLENYELTIEDAVAPRKIVPAETIVVGDDGTVEVRQASRTVRFRDTEQRIKPVAPFFQVWVRTETQPDWIPLTVAVLEENGLTESSVSWQVEVANIKIQRRTGNDKDRIEAKTPPFKNHTPQALDGTCENFIDNESIPLGSVQYLKPGKQFDRICLRFTPAAGKVYGSRTTTVDPNVTRAVYDPLKGNWHGYREPDNPANDYAGRRLTNPGEIFAGYNQDGFHISYGYVDDECDGIIEASLTLNETHVLRAFARVAAGPPTFAPDGKPLRTVADELEQALLGPDAEANPDEVNTVRDLVRRALETVRLMNTGHLNKGGTVRGVGMARMDSLDYNRRSEPIFDPTVAESLAIRSRHERVLLALESGSLAWFANVLREYDKVGDLTDAGRRMMPGMMRNADGRHLALTRRQVSKVKAVAEYIVKQGVRPDTATDRSTIPAALPLNLTAQLTFRPAGNPPNSAPDTAISNAYPGLEMDIRNIWKRVLEGVVLHESLNFVLEAEGNNKDLKGMFVTRIADVETTAPVTGPGADGKPIALVDGFNSNRMALEWSNALATLIHLHAGDEVPCVFVSADGAQQLNRSLRLRHVFEKDSAVIARDIAEPGALTQSLCAPWQNDYRECACFYWAASRPDYVNVEPRPDGASEGNNWMQKNRTASTPKVYISDDWQDQRLYSHSDLIQHWEKLLRFVIGNEDEPAVE